MWRSSLLVLAGSALLLGSVCAAGEAQALLPDPSQGSVAGKTGIIGWPVDPASEEFLSPFGLELVMVPERDQDRELRFPAGSWVSPPPGRYKLWLEGEGRMSPGFMVLNYSAAPFTGQGRVLALPLAAAGKVKLAPSSRATEHVLRLLHLDRFDGRPPQREVTRRVVGDARFAGAWMPTGTVVAALFDPDRRRYVGLSSRIRVSAGTETHVDPAPPAADRSHLIVRLERPGGATDRAAAVVELQARRGDQTFPPDVVVSLVDRVYAFWYDLIPGTAMVEGGGAASYLPPTEVVLQGGAIASVEASLRPRPSLEVSVQLPESLRGEARLTIVERSDGSPLRETPVSGAESTYSFPHLPASEIVVALEARPWVFIQRVDLRAGNDERLTFSPAPIELHGSLYWGDESWPGTIELSIDDKRGFSVEIVTDEDGDYETTLFKGGNFAASFRLEGVGQPYLELLDAIHSSGRLDFRLPRNHFVVEVVDRADGRPVPEARVTFMNADEQGKASAQEGATGADGRFRLPPLRAGTLSLTVSKDGFSDETRDDISVLGDSKQVNRIRVELRAETESWLLEILSASGVPLPGAAVAVADIATGRIFWSETSDGSGLVEVPIEIGGNLLMMRHPDAGFDLRPIPPTPEQHGPTPWPAPPKAQPVVVRTVEANGDPSAWSGVVLWVDGIRLRGELLGWLTLGSGGSDGAGFWHATNLPAGTTIVVEALRPGTAAASSIPPAGPTIDPASTSPLAVVVR